MLERGQVPDLGAVPEIEQALDRVLVDPERTEAPR
jgi:hypothetical protein